MLDKLTSKQEAMLPKYLKEWTDLSTPLDRDKATEWVRWLYEEAKLKEPMVIFVSSPLACQYAIPIVNEYLKLVGQEKRETQVGNQVRAQVGNQVRNQVWTQVEAQVGNQVWNQVWNQVGDQVRAQVGNQVWDQVRDQVRNQVEAQVWSQVWDQVGNQVGTQVRNQVRDQVWNQVGEEKLSLYSFANYGSIWDYGWCSFYSFFKDIGIVQHESFKEFLKIKQTGIYDMIQLDGLCVVCEMPKHIHRDELNRLHCEDGYAIKWDDGYALSYWHGIKVPDKLTHFPEEINQEDIKKESNAEIRRCYQEALGDDRYAELLGVVTLEKTTDRSGRELLLKETRDPDPSINEKIKYIVVSDTSTERQYYLCVPPEITSARQGLAWTGFKGSWEEYNPIVET